MASADGSPAAFPPKVWVHLDLKGAPPTVGYLLALMPYLRAWGATGLLIEWEDMFPWGGTLAELRHSDAYSAEEVRARGRERSGVGTRCPRGMRIGVFPSLARLEAALRCSSRPRTRSSRRWPAY